MQNFSLKTFTFFLLVVFVIAGNAELSAQSYISSPYSSFGLGNLYNGNNIRNKGMGNISTGMRDYFTINVNNPASYTAFDSTSFVFEAGVVGHNTQLKTDELSETITGATMSHLLFGFPVTNWWRSSFGLLPYSGVGYNVTDIDLDDNFGQVKYAFEGEGGINRVYWGNGFKPTQFLSFGINASYMFGTINKIQKVSFPDSTNVLSARIDNKVAINDIYLDFGIQLHMPLNEKIDMTVGVTYNPKIDMKAKKTYLSRTYLGTINGVDLIQDTVKFQENIPGTVVFPDGFGLGFNIAKSYDWSFGADYKFNNWSGFESFGLSDSLINSHSFNLGGSIIPDRNSFSYFKRVEFRLGGHYDMSFLKLRNEQINGFGITFGAGLPLRGASLRRSKSMLNIAVEYGRRGMIKNGLIQENYFNVHLGLSISEWWFFKKRYN
jgi:long-subunit fatty acid transport protein